VHAVRLGAGLDYSRVHQSNYSVLGNSMPGGRLFSAERVRATQSRTSLSGGGSGGGGSGSGGLTLLDAGGVAPGSADGDAASEGEEAADEAAARRARRGAGLTRRSSL
jgi:hypothetical protein